MNKAGQTIRRMLRGEDIPEDRAVDAIQVIQTFRALHRIPLTKANMGLRSMVSTEGCQVEVTQRLKRLRTIFSKTHLQPTLPLWSMQDIGGCRAVLDSVDEVRRVQRRLTKNRPPLSVDDYISNPKASGYRGVHVVVEYDQRKIEVQLRTRVMHEWALAVEVMGSKLAANLKNGRGPAPVLDLFAAASEAMALEEAHEPVGQDLEERIARLRKDALPFLGGHP